MSREGPSQRHVLVLNYTMTCPLSCDFCCYGCGPKRREVMPIELAQRLIHQAAEMGVFSSVAFTGGEPMVFEEDLLLLGAELKSLRLPFSIATSAHWATSNEKSERTARALADLGLVKVGISSDPSHEAFVPRANVLRAAMAFADVGVKTYVVGAFSDSSMNVESYFPELSGRSGIHVQSHEVQPVGRGSKAHTVEAPTPIQNPPLSCYRAVFHDIVVFHDGHAYPCCSVSNRAARYLRLGNAYQDSLETLYLRAEGSLLIRTLKRRGFSEAYAIAGRHDPTLSADLPALDSARNACTLCKDIFRNESLAKRLKEAFAKEEGARIEQLLNVVQLQATSSSGFERLMEDIQKEQQ